MSIEGIALYRYEIRLARPMPVRARELTTRTGLILELTGKDGHTAYGEIAPLPGFSRESVEEAQRQVLHLIESQPERSLDEQFKHFDARNWRRLMPSVRCGYSMAMRAHLANEAGESIYKWLGGKRRDRISLCALLSGSAGEMLDRAERLRAAGYRAVKVKVGRGRVEDDIELVRSLSDRLGPDVALRPDANQAWDLSAALQFAEGVRACAIDYIEEPLQDPRALPGFARQAGMPYAVDESLAPVLGLFFDVACGAEPRGCLDAYRGPALSDRETISEVLKAAKALVVKPSLAGEYGRLPHMSRQLHGHDLEWVVSSSFESPVGLAALARLAACMNDNDVPAGLDTGGLAPAAAELDLAALDAVSFPVDGNEFIEVYRA